MTAEEALVELTTSTAEAVAGVLRTFLPDQVEVDVPQVVQHGDPPLAGVPVPGVAAEVSYADGASGGTLFVTTITGMRTLAAATRGASPEPGAHPLDELELSAVAEAMDRMMAAGAGAVSTVLGQQVEMSRPAVRDLPSVEEALELARGATHTARIDLTLAGEPCRLVQLVPRAFIVKMTRALDEVAAVEASEMPAGGGPGVDGPEALLQGVTLRVCAEIGRAAMPLAQAVALPPGGVVELDRGADEPVDLLVNGRRFATGRLVLVDDEWAVRVEDVFLDPHHLPPATRATIERG